jgi:predicted nucleotidyltransferase
MPKPPADFLTILRVLHDHDVNFVVIGGVSAVLQGAPLATFDLDIVHARDDANVERLLAALRSLDAFYREHPARRPPPTARGLSGPGHHLLMTSAGPLDILGEVSGNRIYADLIEQTSGFVLGEDLEIRVLNLATLIRLKEELGRDKDVAALAVLRRTLEEHSKEQHSN